MSHRKYLHPRYRLHQKFLQFRISRCQIRLRWQGLLRSKIPRLTSRKSLLKARLKNKKKMVAPLLHLIKREKMKVGRARTIFVKLSLLLGKRIRDRKFINITTHLTKFNQLVQLLNSSQSKWSNRRLTTYSWSEIRWRITPLVNPFYWSMASSRRSQICQLQEKVLELV